MPRYGFNFLWMYVYNPERPDPQEANLRELDFIANEGFNFVRIPTDYNFWTRGDYFHHDERILAYIDRYIEACNERGLHVSFNVHRVPGYCINWPEREKHNLWKDEEALEGFKFMWETFAKRYRGISSEKLSFDLVNEPASIPPTHPCTRDDHERVIRQTIAAIRAVDPERQIVIDGFNGGGSALPELADLGSQNVIHSGRGYYPGHITHHNAEWNRDYKYLAVEPTYERTPESLQALYDFYQPWRDVQAQGVPVHIGEFGCYNKIQNQTALNWFADLFEVFHNYGWGFSMWNLKGAFGIVEHGRPGTKYEEYHGMMVDRALVDMMLAARV